MGKTKKHKEFYEKDTPHGYVKRMMYKKYLQAYIAKTQNEQFNLKTIIIDGFAGPGRYSNYKDSPKEIAKYGSPLIALKVTLDFLLKKANKCMSKACATQPTAITLIFIEVNERHYTSLVGNIKGMLEKFLPRYSYREKSEERKHSTTFSINIHPYSFAIEVHNMNFEQFCPPKELAEECTRSLTFLDPFGFSHTPMNHVKKFAPGEGNEIFIIFMSQAVDSNINKESIRALFGIEDGELDKFVNDISDSKNEKDLNSSSRNCTEWYAGYLKSKTQTAYAQSFEARNETDDIIYHLIHLTNDIRGVEAMKESMNRCSQKRGEMAMSEYHFFQKNDKLNFENLDKDNHNVVADMIFKKFKGEQDVLLEPSTPLLGNTIKEFVLLDTIFLYRKRPIATLQRKGKITKVVDETNMPQKRKNTFPDKDSKTKRPKQWRVSFAQQ